MSSTPEKTSSSSDVINVQSVYELASEIGEHFKKLIELHGSDVSESLIPCVVRVLENLEEVVIQREGYLMMIDKLHLQVEELQRENHGRIQQQQKYQSEVEDIDELWRKENIQLAQYVQHLRSENNRLTSSLKSNDRFSHSLSDLIRENGDGCESSKSDLAESQVELLHARVHMLSQEVALKNEQIESLRAQNENLSQENTNLRNMVTLAKRETMVLSKSTGDEDRCSSLLARIRQLELELEAHNTREDHAIEATEDSLQESVDLDNEVEEVEDEEDPPVQGPIPIPELYDTKRSRIWSFFPRLSRAFSSKK